MGKKKLEASFEVELLPSEKLVAHKRLGEYDTPSLMTYARNYFKEHGKLFGMEGFYFLEASLRGIDELSEDRGLIQFKNWAEKNCTIHFSVYHRFGLEPNTIYTWIRFPNGIWTLQGSYRSLMTWDRRPGKGGVKNDPKGDRLQANVVDAGPLVSFEHERWYRQIENEFPAAWRIARAKLRKEMKDSGEARKLAEIETQNDHVKRTEIRMAALSQATQLRDTLEVFIKSITDETMSVKEIGELYRQLTNLGACNKSMKEIYGSRMPKD